MFHVWHCDDETAPRACSRCHDMKLKCGKQKAGCDRCVFSGVDCEYPHDETRHSHRLEKAADASTNSHEGSISAFNSCNIENPNITIDSSCEITTSPIYPAHNNGFTYPHRSTLEDPPIHMDCTPLPYQSQYQPNYHTENDWSIVYNDREKFVTSTSLDPTSVPLDPISMTTLSSHEKYQTLASPESYTPFDYAHLSDTISSYHQGLETLNSEHDPSYGLASSMTVATTELFSNINSYDNISKDDTYRPEDFDVSVPSPFPYRVHHDATSLLHGASIQTPTNSIQIDSLSQPQMFGTPPCLPHEQNKLSSYIPPQPMIADANHLPQPHTLASPGLFRMPQGNTQFYALRNPHAKFADAPDLYASLYEEPLQPPPEDMIPFDLDMVPYKQNPRFKGDLYTPELVRGHGSDPEGWCGLCKPGRWLGLKNSAYWQDRLFTHGISAATGAPFPQPLDERRTKTDPDMWEGLCGCNEWIAFRSRIGISSPWFKHAYQCQKDAKASDLPKGVNNGETEIHKTGGYDNNSSNKGTDSIH